MPDFKWSAQNEVFLPALDTEHRDLFLLGDGLQEALRRGDDDELGAQLDGLAAHFESHFEHEERLMRAVGYPSYGWHRAQHDTVRRRIKLLAPLASGGDKGAAGLLLEFLAGWLQDHTFLTDKMMAAFLRNYSRSHPRQWSSIQTEFFETQPELIGQK